jgi:hypothetical protein
MDTSTTYPRLNIYLDDPALRAQIKIAAARRGVTLSAYCVEAIRQRLTEDGLLPADEAAAPQHPQSPQAAARALDDLRRRIGPVGVPVHELIAEGRRR